jgi:hypothetical protein
MIDLSAVQNASSESEWAVVGAPGAEVGA